MAKRKPKEQHKLVKQIVEKTFSKDVNTTKIQEIKEDVINYYYSKYGGKNVSAAFQFDDTEVSHWRQNDHFAKIFHFELNHAEEYYSLTKAQKHFILDISDYLMWEMNILVDEEDKPLNQKRLAEKMYVTPKSIRDNMEPLIEKNIIHKIEIGSDVFYYVNPYIVFRGKDINANIPMLFDELGYVNSNMINGNSRSHRRKEQEKRLSI